MPDISFMDRPTIPWRPVEVVTLWYGDDDGFMHRRNGRFHHRHNLPHIARCVNLIRQRNAQGEEVRVDG